MSKKIIIGAIVLILCGGVIWYGTKYTADQADKKIKESKESVKETYNLTDKELEELDLSDEDVEKLADEKKAVEDKEVEKPSEKNVEIKNIVGYEENVSKVEGIKLPYKIKDTDMIIESIGQYTGPFIEDGNDKPTGNVISLVVKNNSDKVIQYGEINLKVNNKDIITFKLTNIPSKTSVLVMESTGKYKYNKKDSYKCLTSIQAELDKMTLMKDKIEVVTVDDGKIAIKNKSNDKLDTVYVYYKYFQDGGTYLGGITYRSKFENLEPGETKEEKIGHFSKNFSEIVMIDSIENN